MSALRLCCLILAAVGCGAPVSAAEPPAATARQLFGHFSAATHAPPLAIGQDLAAGERIQTEYLALLARELGGRAGYKAGLTGAQAQRRFGIDHPILGVLLRDMLVPSPARLAADSGARLLIEADLIVRVRSAAINDARNWNDLLAGLDAVIPFIEIPDLLFATEVAIDAPMLQAANVGARWGVLGQPIPLVTGQDWYQRLGEFQVSLQDDRGVVGEGRGRDLLGHPLAAVEWLRDAVRARGEHLSAGDLLSLGSLTSLRPVRPGVWRAIYTGLDPQGPVTLTVEIDPVAEPALPGASR